MLAKTFRYRTEILADHNAPVRDALLRGDRQQRLERHPHIDAVARGNTVGHQIEPQQPEAVSDPLDEFDELDFHAQRPGTERSAALVVGLPPFFRPFPPWAVELMAQRLEAGKAREQATPLGAKGLEILLASGIQPGAERRE